MIDQDTSLVPWEPARQQIMHLPYPVWKVQRRTKRVFTLWVVRDTPDYFRHRDWRYDVSYQSEFFKLKFMEECRWWREGVGILPGFECIAVWPTAHWVHLTIKVYWWNQSFDKAEAKVPIELGDWREMQGIKIDWNVVTNPW